MNRYFATFPAGTFELIAKQLKSFKLSQLEIIEEDNSSVVFQSSLPIERIIEFRYFTNAYLIADAVNAMPKAALKGKYYRLMLLAGGTPHPIAQSERAELELKIKQDLHLEPNTHLSKNDFYFIERAEGKKLFTLRLPRAKFKREKLMAGELRPELAHILCLAAGIKAKHTVLDMFAGYGSLPYEAVRGFGCKQVIASDNRKLPNRHEHPFITWHTAEASHLDFFADHSIDRIVTDPPWGVYDRMNEAELKNLYKQALKEMQRVLKPRSTAVLLSGNIALDDAIQESGDFSILKSYPILVSGKKARILKLQT